MSDDNPGESPVSRFLTSVPSVGVVMLALGLSIGAGIGYFAADDPPPQSRTAQTSDTAQTSNTSEAARVSGEPRYAPGKPAPDPKTPISELRAEPYRKPPMATPNLEAAPAPEFDPAAPDDAGAELVALAPVPDDLMAEDGDPPWMRYAVAAPVVDGRPMVAVVIDDMGMDRGRSDKIVALPAPLTTAWLTYADQVNRQAAEARSKGHELLLHVAMEPTNPDLDAGPDVLRVGDAPGDLRARLRELIGRVEGVVGINNHMGSLFTEDEAGMSAVLEELRHQGLLFLDSRTTPDSVSEPLARLMGVPFAQRHVFLDNENTKDAVLKQLDQVQRIAEATGRAIAIGHPRDGTLEALAEWLPALEDKGLVLVPLSAVVARGEGVTLEARRP